MLVFTTTHHKVHFSVHIRMNSSGDSRRGGNPSFEWDNDWRKIRMCFLLFLQDCCVISRAQDAFRVVTAREDAESMEIEEKGA